MKNKRGPFSRRLENRLDMTFANFSGKGAPSARDFAKWIALAVSPRWRRAEINVQLLDVEDQAECNERFRGKSGPTNVLSFAYNEGDDWTDPAFMYNDRCELRGEILICPEVVEREAEEQGKSARTHYAHLAIHGALHLQGHDHVEEEEARVMESLETKLMAFLGHSDPYRPVDDD